MLHIQLRILNTWSTARATARQRIDDARDTGEITATTAMIVILVIAAVAAGGIIATKIRANANNVPTP